MLKCLNLPRLSLFPIGKTSNPALTIARVFALISEPDPPLGMAAPALEI